MAEKYIHPLALRVRDFMREHDRTHEQMANVLDTPPRTLNNWLNDGRSPPPLLGPMMTALEQIEEVRVLLGVHEAREKGKPRGKPFRRGNPWRFARKAAQKAASK